MLLVVVGGNVSAATVKLTVFVASVLLLQSVDQNFRTCATVPLAGAPIETTVPVAGAEPSRL